MKPKLRSIPGRTGGRIFHAIACKTGKPVTTWTLDFVVPRCPCGLHEPDKSHRFREASNKTTVSDALDELERHIQLRTAGKAVEAPLPTTLKDYVTAQ